MMQELLKEYKACESPDYIMEGPTPTPHEQSLKSTMSSMIPVLVINKGQANDARLASV